MGKTVNSGYIIFLAAVSAIGGILFGYDTAVISGTIGIVTQQFSLDTIQQGWYVGCALIGSIAGATFAGMLSDAAGRKKTMLTAAVLFCICAIGCAESRGFVQLVISRIIGGIGVGIVSIVSPIYISEVSTAEKRGTLVSLYQLAVTVGFLIAYLVNYVILDISETRTFASGFMNRLLVDEYWRGMLGSGIFPSLLFLIILFFIPESPKWLITKGKGQAATNVLSRMYLTPEGVEREYETTKASIGGETKSDWKELLSPGILRRCPVLAGTRRHREHAYDNHSDVHNRQGRTQTAGLLGRLRYDIVPYNDRNLFFMRRKTRSRERIHADILPVLRVLLRDIHQCRSVRAAFRNVPEQCPRQGHVHSRFLPVDRHVSYRTAHAMAAGESDSGRDLLPVRRHVHTLHADNVESRTGNDWKDSGRNRGILERKEKGIVDPGNANYFALLGAFSYICPLYSYCCA